MGAMLKPQPILMCFVMWQRCSASIRIFGMHS